MSDDALSYECEHQHSILTRRTVANGTVQVWRQCRRCGAAVGSAVARARGVCEGCRSARATQVHHLTYQHAGHVVPGGELLWELVAVCDDCHDRAHMRAVSEQERAA